MERRTFVRLSAYTAMALTLPFADSCTSTSTDKTIAQPFFFSHLVDIKAINEAGRAYRKLIPVEDDKTILIKLLLGDNNRSTEKKTIQALLNNRVKQDFKAGKIVIAKGWVLSITEGRQCALYSIINA
ncbi:MAG: hypothetical protein JWP37_3111 [Mucilaginibacter sp.]|nr:hypothetical protein [Mucilaginibacter sp.]